MGSRSSQHRLHKLLLAGVSVITLLSESAGAADLARPAPVYAPLPPPAVFTWSGCYLGANGGGLWSSEDWTDNSGFFGVVGQDFGTHNANGGLGGLQIGCNYQVANWVLGIQGDADWVSANGSNSNVPAALFFSAIGPGTVIDRTRIHALASITGRVGYAWGRFLGYVKGGGAWINIDYAIEGQFAASPLAGGTIASLNTTHDGWTVGVGGEYAFLDWLTAFVEYDHYAFGTQTETFSCGSLAVCVTAAGMPIGGPAVRVQHNVNIVKAGLNLKFGVW